MFEIKFSPWEIRVAVDVTVRHENPELDAKLEALEARLAADREKLKKTVDEAGKS
jgi:BMFP domain-containing protein YqiC